MTFPLTSPLKFVRLTPAGRGAVAVMLLTGHDAVNVFLKHWHGKPPVRTQPVFGRLQLTDGLCEEAVVHLTEDHDVELHVHGGEQVIAAAETLFASYGAVSAAWENFFAPGNSQREIALRMLPFAPTERTAQILLDQYHGTQYRKTPCDTSPARFESLLFLGKHLIDPFRIVFAGAANAGKSSLINAILGFQRCLVNPAEGTTRDTVCVHTAIEGFPAALYDTAGFRETDEELELLGIERSRQSLNEADLIVWVVDPAVDGNHSPPFFIPSSIPLVLCCNKIDLADDPNIPLKVSALTGEGIDTLLQTMIRCLVPYPPEPGEAVPLTEI